MLNITKPEVYLMSQAAAMNADDPELQRELEAPSLLLLGHYTELWANMNDETKKEFLTGMIVDLGALDVSILELKTKFEAELRRLNNVDG